jgi:hypothetical protein
MKGTIRRRAIFALVLIAGPLAVGTIPALSCAQTVLEAVNPCGTVLSNCTPADWYRWMVWPYVNYPDYSIDPSCVIPYACTDWFGNAATRGGGTSTTTGSTTSSSTSSSSSSTL